MGDINRLRACHAVDAALKVSNCHLRRNPGPVLVMQDLGRGGPAPDRVPHTPLDSGSAEPRWLKSRLQVVRLPASTLLSQRNHWPETLRLTYPAEATATYRFIADGAVCVLRVVSCEPTVPSDSHAVIPGSLAFAGIVRSSTRPGESGAA